MKTKKGDFIEIDFIGKIKETDTIFDLTKEADAKKYNLYNPNQKYRPLVLCLGENEVIMELDQQLTGKETGKSYKIEISSEKGFGKKNPKLIKLISSNIFKKQRITPFPGLQLNIDGILGIVRAVSGGRIIVDFNHPLAGKTLIYELIINKIVKDPKERVESILKTDKFELKNDELNIKISFPERLQEILKKKIKKHVSSIKKITFLKTPLKDN